MNLIFGMNLDRGAFPRPHHRKEAVLGEDACGPIKFLKILETRLGLGGPRPDSVVRTDVYRRKLKAADNGKRFYSISFEIDPLGVARTLIRWRDELVLAGMNLSPANNVPARFADLIAVESALPDEPLSEGIADQLIAVERILRAGQSSGVVKIALSEPRDLLPPFWQRLFALLEKSGTIISEASLLTADGDPSSDLHRVKAALVRGNKTELKGDGSLIILNAASDNEAADVLAQWFCAIPTDRALLIHSYDKRTLDTALMRHGAPALGINSYSGSRPILNILPLIGGLLWRPFNPQALLELLSLPVSPVPRILARKLAAAIAKEPGLGGPEWVKAVAECLELSKKAQDPRKTEDDIRNALNDWLEFPRQDPRQGLKKSAGVLVFRKLSAWAGKRSAFAGDSEQRLLRILSSGAANLADLLDQYENDMIPQSDFLDIVASVSGMEVLGDESQPEAGHLPWVPHPGCVIGDVPLIVWWDFAADAAPPTRSFLNPDEKEWLKGRGLATEITLNAIKRSIHSDTVPFLKAFERLLLVVPRSIAGTELPHHPMLDTLRAVAVKSLDLCRISASKLLGGDVSFGDLKLAATKLAPAQLPQPQPVWALNKPVTARDKESYSSLNELMSAPYAWFLHHKAKLKRGNFLTLPEMRMLKGTLAHVMIQELLGARPDLRSWKEDEIGSFIEEHFERLLVTRGALLLQPGRETEAAAFRYMLKNSCATIVRTLAENGWKFLESEGVRGMDFGGTPFEAKIDLILECPKRGRALLDLKDSSFKRYREKMETGLFHQLVLYSRALTGGKDFTPFAYYLISSGKIVAPDQGAFTGDNVWCPPEPYDHRMMWEQMLATYRWRLDELRQGRVAIDLPPEPEDEFEGDVAEEAEPRPVAETDGESPVPQPPPGTLPIEILEGMREWIDSDIDHAILTGSLESL